MKLRLGRSFVEGSRWITSYSLSDSKLRRMHAFTHWKEGGNIREFRRSIAESHGRGIANVVADLMEIKGRVRVPSVNVNLGDETVRIPPRPAYFVQKALCRKERATPEFLKMFERLTPRQRGRFIEVIIAASAREDITPIASNYMAAVVRFMRGEGERYIKFVSPERELLVPLGA